MNKAIKTRKRGGVFVLATNGGARKLQHSGVVLCRNRTDIVAAMRDAGPRSRWISVQQKTTDELLRSIPECTKRGKAFYGLVTMVPPRPNSLSCLTSCFRRWAGIAADCSLLPLDELVEVLSAPAEEAAGLFIAGAVDSASETIALTKGNLKTLAVPFSAFQPSGTGTSPDFNRLRLADCGHTVCLGEYEASADAILYEVDPAYRRKTRKKMLAEEKTFGGSLRRLRLQKGLTRDDFPPLSSKTIARIERNEVEKPHGETMRIISARLDVDPEDIETY